MDTKLEMLMSCLRCYARTSLEVLFGVLISQNQRKGCLSFASKDDVIGIPLTLPTKNPHHNRNAFQSTCSLCVRI